MMRDSHRAPSDSFIPAYNQPYATKTLSGRDFDRFQKALRQEEPSDNLKRAVHRHNEMLSSSDKM